MKRFIVMTCAFFLVLCIPAFTVYAQDAVPAPAQTSAPAPQVPVSQNLLAYFTNVPEATMTILVEASDLADQGKWASAFKVLQDYDAPNADPFVLALKTEIALKGNAQTYMHKVFAFVDILPGKDLNMIRMVGAENAEPVEFDPPELAAAIESAGTELPPVLYKNLGDYYFEALNNYSGQWIEDDETVSMKILENYERAIAGEAYDQQTLFRQGEILLRTGNTEAAGMVLGKYLALNPDDAQARFNLAKSLVTDGKTDEAFAEINTLLAADTGAQLKTDIFMFAIQTAVDLQDAEKTESYLTAMQNENPDDFVPGLIRHLLSVRDGDEAAAALNADSLLSKTQGDPNVVRSLVSSWLNESKPEPAMAFLDRGIVRHQEKPQILGALYFYKSLLQAEMGQAPEDFASALATMDLAEENFKKALPSDSPVFATIAELREKLKQSMEGPAPEAIPATDAPAATGDTDATSSASESTEEAVPVDPAAPVVPAKP